mmetsp:Transcript_57736/g.130822  ORF Transcript_57736/g.130822 Transcript_57736/m.130822 type:complete len:342 (-) Transcript_57736:169-1194(-)
MLLMLLMRSGPGGRAYQAAQLAGPRQIPRMFAETRSFEGAPPPSVPVDDEGEEGERIPHEPVPVLARGATWAVLAKPGGIPCHESDYVGRWRPGVSQGPPPPAALLQRGRDTLGQRINLVHRLDRGASGGVLCSLDEGATSGLQAALASEAAVKTYVALVRGSGEMYGEFLRDRGWFTVDRSIKNEKGRVKNATTEFMFLGGQDEGPSLVSGEVGRARCSLVLARPKTGRWHQIRRHLNGLNHPILGDSSHGSTATNREWRAARGLRGERLLLHLARLQLPPPGKSWAARASSGLPPGGLDVACPLAEDFRELLETQVDPGVLEESRGALEEHAGLADLFL